jgi:hypothetical protein
MAITKLTLTQTRRGARRWVGMLSLTAVFALVFSLSACGAGSSTGQNAAGGTTESASGLSESGSTGTVAGTTAATGTAGSGTTSAGVGTGAGSGSTGTAGSTGSTGEPATGGTVSSASYLITVYYTAVESFHTDAAQNVSGCLIRECSFGSSLIGSYPANFIKATKTEGTGRITSGANAGKYLNWSVDVGYWLDTIPSDGYGTALVPFRTAAADDMALTRGTQFRLVAPLIQEDGSALDSTSANRLLAAQWLVNDQFTPGLGGALHLDLYIGEEDRVNFTSSPLYTTLANVKMARL